MEDKDNQKNSENDKQIKDNDAKENNEKNNENEIQDNFNINNIENYDPKNNEVQPQIVNQEAPPANFIVNNVNNNIINNIVNNNEQDINTINNEIDKITNNVLINKEEEDRKVVELIKSKIHLLLDKYIFSIQFSEIIIKILKFFQDLTYVKLTNSLNEILNFIPFFKDFSDTYAKLAKQIKEANNIIKASKKEEEKLSDNTLFDVMQKTHNAFYQNIIKISSTMKQNIVNKGPLSKLDDLINKIEKIKKENLDKIKDISDLKIKMQKYMKQYDKLFKAYSPNLFFDVNNNTIEEMPNLIDTPDLIIIIRSLLGFINKLILDVNLFIIDTKDTFYKINELYIEINNLVKGAILIYIQQCKTIFNSDLTKNFEEIENYYKKFDDNTSDKMFKMQKIFSTKENEDNINNLLQQYYTLLFNSNCLKKELLKDRNKYSINYTSNLFLFFEWLISVSPQPSDITIHELLIKQISLKRDPGIFSFWKECFFLFTKQHHLLVLDKPGTTDDLVSVFELDKTSFRKKEDKTNKFLFELIANKKGKIMDFKGAYLFDAMNKENIEEIMNLVYNS